MLKSHDNLSERDLFNVPEDGLESPRSSEFCLDLGSRNLSVPDNPLVMLTWLFSLRPSMMYQLRERLFMNSWFRVLL